MAPTINFRTLGLGEMEDKHNEYMGGVYPQKYEVHLAKVIEEKILKIVPTERKRSTMRMMVIRRYDPI